MRKAIEDYHMIENGDKIAVGVSGGKDSVSLLAGLAALRRFIGIDCEIALPLDGKGNYRYLSVKNNRVSVK